MFNLFNWVQNLVEAFTFYGGGKGGGSTSTSTSTPVDFFGVGNRAPYANLLGQLLGVGPMSNYGATGVAGSGTSNYGSGSSGKKPEATNLAALIQSQPGYQFGMNQGLNALNANYASTGQGPSGAQQVALQGYGQQYAGQYYQNLINNLMAPSGSGIVAQQTTSSSQSSGASPLFGVAGMALGGYLQSDRNFKTNIKHIDTIKGIKIYSFNYIWSYIKSIGVMAQDLLEMPEYKDAVHLTNYGYVVDYSKLPI